MVKAIPKISARRTRKRIFYQPKNSINKTQESPLTSNKKRSRSPSATASFSSSTYATCSSSSSPPSPSTLSSPPQNFKMSLLDKELSSSPSVARNLFSQLPPLPPSPSPKLLRRSFSDPVSDFPAINCSVSKEDNPKVKMEEQDFKVEKLSIDLTLIKFKCQCGSYNRLIFSDSETKLYKLVD